MLYYQNLMALCYLFLTSTLQKNEIYTFKQLQFYDQRTEESNYERSKVRNKFLKTRNEESKRHFNHRRNFC